MFILVIILLFFFIFKLFFSNKLRIDIHSFLRKGFKRFNDNQYGCYCFCGRQGTGKTYSCVHFIDEFFNKPISEDYILITNILSLSKSRKAIYLQDIYDIISFVNKNNNKKYVIFYDEIFTCVDKSGTLSKEIRSFLSQMRKRKLIFITTAQVWYEINLTMRRYIRYEIDCSMHSIFNQCFLLNSFNDAENSKWDEEVQDMTAPRLFLKLRKGNKKIIDMYDTFETISVSKK